MLTLERIKVLLDDPQIPDNEAKEIANALYLLADLICDALDQENL